MKESWKQPVPPSHVAVFDGDEGKCYSCAFQPHPFTGCEYFYNAEIFRKRIAIQCPRWKKREQRKEE